MDIEAARLLGAGIASIALIGAGVGIGIIFGNYLNGALRNPGAAAGQFTNLLVGFALCEFTGLLGVVMAFIILFTEHAMAAATIEGTEKAGAPAEGGLPQLNPEHFAGQIFWLAITFGLLFILLSRVTLPKIAGALADRKTRIDSDLAAAEQSKKNASDALAAYEAALASARGRALALADENRKRIVGEIEAIKHAADAKAQEAMGKAEARIAAERARAEGNIRTAAAEAAASIVERLLGVPVSADEAAKAVDAEKKAA